MIALDASEFGIRINKKMIFQAKIYQCFMLSLFLIYIQCLHDGSTGNN